MTAAAAVKTAVGMSTQFCAGWPTMHGTCRAAVNQKAGAGVAEAAVEGVVEVGSVALAELQRAQRSAGVAEGHIPITQGPEAAVEGAESLESELAGLGAHFK